MRVRGGWGEAGAPCPQHIRHRYPEIDSYGNGKKSTMVVAELLSAVGWIAQRVTKHTSPKSMLGILPNVNKAHDPSGKTFYQLRIVGTPVPYKVHLYGIGQVTLVAGTSSILQPSLWISHRTAVDMLRDAHAGMQLLRVVPYRLSSSLSTEQAMLNLIPIST